MAKDPAFLFYPNDYIGGTMGMTFEEKGAYMELLMMQFNRGHMTSHMIGQTVGQLWDKIQDKFIKDENGLYYNARLDEEKFKRQKYSNSRHNNKLGTNQYSNKDTNQRGHMTSHMIGHMENENENINKDIIVIDKIEGVGERKEREEIDYLKISEIWNKTNSPKVRDLTQPRKDKIKKRIQSFKNYLKVIGKEESSCLLLIEALCYKIAASDFCTGKTTPWRATFDWLFENDKNWLKVAEGNYDNIKSDNKRASIVDTMTELAGEFYPVSEEIILTN